MAVQLWVLVPRPLFHRLIAVRALMLGDRSGPESKLIGPGWRLTIAFQSLHLLSVSIRLLNMILVRIRYNRCISVLDLGYRVEAVRLQLNKMGNNNSRIVLLWQRFPHSFTLSALTLNKFLIHSINSCLFLFCLNIQIENVRMLDRYNSRKPSTGTLYLTATHLIFVDPDAKKETWVKTSTCSPIWLLKSHQPSHMYCYIINISEKSGSFDACGSGAETPFVDDRCSAADPL